MLPTAMLGENIEKGDGSAVRRGIRMVGNASGIAGAACGVFLLVFAAGAIPGLTIDLVGCN